MKPTKCPAKKKGKKRQKRGDTHDSGKKNLERPPQSPRKLPPFGPFPPSGISNALRWDVGIFWNYTIIIFKIKEFLPTGQFLMGRSFSS